MKYICFGYLDVQNWEKKSPSEQSAMIDQCFAYDEVLKKNGFWIYGLSANGKMNLGTETFDAPCAFVIGNEGAGIRGGIQRRDGGATPFHD